MKSSPLPHEAGTIRVTLIEDDADARQLFAGWLASTKDLVCLSQFGDAESAVQALQANPPDVVLTDINLPGITGIECVKRLKPLLPRTQFIMLTMYSDSEHLFDALTAGASGYLLKRTSCEDLIKAVRDAHAGAAPMTGSIARRVVQFFHSPKPEPVKKPDNNLSAREQQVLDLLASGHLYKEIADTLGISVLTVNTHVRNIYEKMHVRSRAQAVAKMTQQGAQRPGPFGS